MNRATACEGCVITESTITDSVIGIRSIIEKNTQLVGVISMGADYYETDAQKEENKKNGIPNIGIGENTRVQRAIIDKNARIGKNCSIGFSPNPPSDGDHGMYYAADGIIIIRKNAIIPDGSNF
jgi:glucose-1-phosphate adenylyltransferase